MFKYIAFIPLFFCVNFFLAAQDGLAVDSAVIGFSVKNFGLEVHGTFSDLSVELHFDPEDLDASSIYAWLPAATIETGIGLRDKHLRKEEFFFVEEFPRIEMRSQTFTQTGQGQFVGSFQLQLKATRDTLNMPFSVREEGEQMIFEGSFTINRKAFDIGGDSLTLADDVTVFIYLRTR